MKQRLNLSMRRSNAMALVGILSKSFLIVLGVNSAVDCSKSNHEDRGFQVSAPGTHTIDAIPFGELNGKAEFNASGIVMLADSRFLISDNNTNDALFELKLSPNGQKQGRLIRRPLQGLASGSVDDLEDMTLVEEQGHRFVFVTSSLYIKKGKKDAVEVPPSGVLRVTINPDDTLRAENMPGFREWLIKAYPQLAASARAQPDDGGLNIEGFTWDKRRQAFLFGIRTPVLGGKPLVLPVKVKDLAGPWTTDNLEAQPLIQLSVDAALGAQGIRALANEPGREVFLVIAGKSTSDSTAPFALYEWDGNGDGALRRFKVEFGKKMKPEGITRGSIGGKSALIIVDDNGGFQVVWADQQLPFAGKT